MTLFQCNLEGGFDKSMARLKKMEVLIIRRKRKRWQQMSF
jgi:hypothetical protein